jgi:anti-sigma regulatory factor (Ser/Thr protein kinase)
VTGPVDLARGTVGFAVSLPADSGYIRLARMLVAAFAGDHLDLPDEEIDGLRIAVSEIFTAALDEHHAAGSADRIKVMAAISGHTLEVVLRHAGNEVSDAPRLSVARSLVDTAETLPGPVIAIRLSAAATD